MPPRSIVASIVVVLAFAAGCEPRSPFDRARAAYMDTDSMGTVVTVRRVAARSRPELRESSGVAVSLSQPGVFFVINDSGNEPFLFAMDTSGVDRGVWRVGRATNTDWESIAAGPCGAKSSPPDSGAGHCLYIGDTGDNGAEQPRRSVYRVTEPQAQAPGFAGVIPARRLDYRYADRPHDVEAMYVGHDGTIYLLTKRALKDSVGALRPSLVFTIPPGAWAADTLVVAQLTDSLPIVPGSAPARQLTDASLSPDGGHVAVRTYAQVYVFESDTLTGRIRTTVPPSVCNIAALREFQGEGIGWLVDGELVLTSEGRNAPLQIVRCPLRKPSP